MVVRYSLTQAREKNHAKLGRLVKFVSSLPERSKNVSARFLQRFKKSPIKPTLVSLAPNENIEENQSYVDLLNEQVDKKFDNSNNRNIALAGEYGTGKSSIVRKFVEKRKNKVVIISFATLNSAVHKAEANDKEEVDSNQEETKSGTKIATEDLPLYADTYGVSDRAEANGIQKEIVKQLMFREKSNALPHSKFSRVGAPNFVSNMSVTLLITLIILFFTYKQLEVLSSDVVMYAARAFNIQEWKSMLQITLFSFVVVVIICLLYSIVSRILGRLVLEKMSGGNLSVSFANSKNYFDDYLDEIIYLFERKKYEIVVFEDLDRFDNLLIFERLRALNTALNNAHGLRKRSIRFIYAVRDSLFDNDDIENAGISRAKFFDVIIPVVPFLTFENSLKHFKDNLPGEGPLKVGDNVIRIAAQHITDMRLIHDICNEYLVFGAQLKVGDSSLGLSPDNLFAMVAFKNMYPSEFSKLKNRDNLISNIISEHLEIREKRITNIQSDIEHSTATLREHSSIAEKINSYTSAVNSLLALLGQDSQNYSHVMLDENDNVVDSDYIDKSFWERAQGKNPNEVLLRIKWSNNSYPGYAAYSHVIDISRAMIEGYLGEAINLNELEKVEAEKINREISRQKDLVEELRYASIKSHIDIENREGMEHEVRDCLPKNMEPLPTLIQEGFLDDYYLQYFSTYKGTLSRDALYYRHEFIERGKYSEQYQLRDTDISELLKSLEDTYATGPGMFNASILSYLMRHNEKKFLPVIISRLSDSDEAITGISGELLRTKKYSELELLISMLSKSGYDNIFNTLVLIGNISDKLRLKLLNVAVENANENATYTFSEEAELYTWHNIQNLTPFAASTKKPVDKQLVSAISVLKQMGHRVDLTEINDIAREQIIANALYRITDTNLELAINAQSFSLDEIRFELKNGEEIYKYLFENLDEYINALKTAKPQKYSLKGTGEFENIINQVYSEKKELFEDFISLADGANCIVEDINSLDKGVWSSLIDSEHITIQSSLQNIIDYYLYLKPKESDGIDINLANYLNFVEGGIHLDKEYDKYDESSRDELLREILNSSVVNENSKVNYVTNVFGGRGEYLNISFFNAQDGVLYGKLLSKNLIADTEKSYTRIQQQQWSTRKAYLLASIKALDYVPGIASIDDINHILGDNEINKSLKIAVAGAYTLDKGSLTSDAAEQYAELLVAGKIAQNIEVIKDIASNIESESLVNIVNSMTSDTDKKIIKDIFANSSNAELQKISALSRKRLALEDSDRNRQLLERLKSQGIIRNYGKSWWGTGLAAWVVE